MISHPKQHRVPLCTACVAEPTTFDISGWTIPQFFYQSLLRLALMTYCPKLFWRLDCHLVWLILFYLPIKQVWIKWESRILLSSHYVEILYDNPKAGETEDIAFEDLNAMSKGLGKDAMFQWLVVCKKTSQTTYCSWRRWWWTCLSSENKESDDSVDMAVHWTLRLATWVLWQIFLQRPYYKNTTSTN